MGQIICVPKYHRLGDGFTAKEKMAGWEHPGRRTDGTQTAASWVTDLTSLRKAIILCSYCRVHFNPRKHHYRKFYAADLSGITDGHATNGKCDVCKQWTGHCGGGTTFIHEETYNLVCIDPVDARRKARAKAMATSAWFHIQKQRRA